MTQLLETIQCIDGKPQHLIWHQRRFNQARQQLFQAQSNIDLSTLFEQTPKIGVCRCRILYSQQIEKVEFISYQQPHLRNFKLITADNLDYSFKYADRRAINTLVAQKQQADDIIIIKNQQITDTSIANLAFWDGQQWLTPATPLLTGTTRARLLEQGLIKAAIITPDALQTYSKIALLNALLGFHVIESPKIING